MDAEACGMRGRILLVDLGGASGLGLRVALRAAGLAICACPDVRAGLTAFVRVLPDLIVVEAGGEAAAAIELVEGVRAISDVPLILVCEGDGDGDEGEGELADPLVARARALGVDRCLAAERARDAIGIVAKGLLAERASAAGASSVAPRATPMTVARARLRAREDLRRELERQLQACHGNLAEVGRRMGKDRSTIRYHLRRFGMLTDEATCSNEPDAAPAERAGTRWPTLLRSGSASRRREATDQSSPISRLKA
ncbi:MAG: hypothetical protein R3F35_05470 [Myxococcota bacterium]